MRYISGIVDQVITLNQNVSSQIFTLLEDINGMCPLVRDPLCDNLQDLETCDLSGILGNDLSNIFKTVVEHFAAGERSVIYQEIIKAKSGLQDVQHISSDLDNAASHFNWALLLSMVFSLLLAVLSLFIISSLVFRMPKMMVCLQSRILMPIFVVVVIFAFVFSLLFVTASMTTADVCIYKDYCNNIDMRVLTLLGRFQEALSPIVVEFARFYIQQCPPQLLPKELVEQMDYIIAGVPAIKKFSSIVEESTDLIQGAYGFAETDTQKLMDLADTAQINLCEVAEILKQVRLFFQCENWFPLYETTVYNALCHDGTNGFAYIASTQFVIVFMAFVILTFRVAFWDIQVGDESEEEEEEDLDDENKEIKNIDTEDTIQDDENTRKSSCFSGITGMLISRANKPDHIKSEAIPTIDSRRDAHLEVDNGIRDTFSTLNTTVYFNGVEDDIHAQVSETSTHENTDDNASGDLVLEHQPYSSPGHDSLANDSSESAEIGVEIGHFHNRADAWATWARQFAGSGTNADPFPMQDDSDTGHNISLKEF